MRHPLSTGGDVVETARSIGRTVRPLPAVLSPVMTQRGPGRVLHTITVGLDELKEAAAAAGGTLNDSFMAGITGGLRRYHERHDSVVDELTVTLPISIRKADDAPGGNRITLQRLRVPLRMADPVNRMRAIGARCRAARAERSLPFTDAIAGALNFVPNDGGRQHAQARGLPGQRRHRVPEPDLPVRGAASPATTPSDPPSARR